MRQSRGFAEQIVFGLLAALLSAPASFGAAAAADSGARGRIPAGIDEKEWTRLRRATTWQEVPEFLSPEAMSGLDDEVLEAIRADFAERGRIQVQSDRYLDYDEERNIIYSNARTRIRFGQYMLEADRVLVHVPLQEIQAEGNVLLRAWRDEALTNKSQEIHAESMLFNYRYFEGAAYGVRGQHDVLHFRTIGEEGALPSFRFIGRDQAVMRDVEFTTCDFPDPQYAVRTRDAILVFDDRIFLQRATLYVRHIPVFYLPGYTKSLREEFPWHVTFGNSSRLGTYVNVFYNFWHYRYEPSFEDDEEMVLRNRGHAKIMLNYFSKRGPGAGLKYGYNFDFDKHTGKMALWGMPSDDYRDVEGEEDDRRWMARLDHRSQLRKDLMLQMNVDYMSDPEFYFDIIDPLSVDERGRVPERKARAALTYWKDDYLARVLVEVKERITLDRITNTTLPGDDDFDYDPFPEERRRDQHDVDDGVSSDRYGMVGARLPQVTFGTSHIRLGPHAPVTYMMDLNAFNNLDKGLNFHDTDDDSFVGGLDLYQQLSYLLKFSERYTMLAQIGAGMGVMKRFDDTYNWEPEDFLTVDDEGNIVERTDIRFVDDDTFLLSGTDREISLSDVNPGFMYADARLRFQGRFTDSLTGNLYYIFREGTEDSLGEFYESIGNKTARADLYNYRTKRHWIEGDLRHRLVYPNITTALSAGRNLQSADEIYPNEQVQYASLNSTYRNQRRTMRLSGYVSYRQYQVRDHDDPNEYRRDSLSVGGRVGYTPLHKRWWVEADAYFWRTLNDDPAQDEVDEDLEEFFRDRFDLENSLFRENNEDIIVEAWFGRKFGEKWTVEVGGEYQDIYSGIRNARAIITRDLHNALATVEFRYRRRPWEEVENDYDIQFGLNFKLPGPMEAVMAPQARTLMSQQRAIAMEEGMPGL